MLPKFFTNKTTLKHYATAITNFSTSVQGRRRAKVLMETKPLLEAQAKCKQIWKALMVSDYKKEGVLNDAALQVLLDKQQQNIWDLLQVKTVDQLLGLLDEDEDGFLNEDEQILLFSAVKERMQNLADELSKIHEYSYYKQMMKAIRLLEKDIINYQHILRKRTHQQQLKIYHEIGQQKLEEFNNYWEKQFQIFQEQANMRILTLQAHHQQQMEQLHQQLMNQNNYLKIKPKPIMKELQTQQKLLAVNERYYQAQQIRKQLKVLQQNQQNRVQHQIQQQKQNKKKKLLLWQQKERRQAEIKNKSEFNKLKIKQQQDRARLQKEIKLHYHDITKNQNQASNLGKKIGQTRDELRRVKLKSKRLQSYLIESKAIKSQGNLLAPHTAPGQSRKSGILSSISTNFGFNSASALKSNMKDVTKFNIKSDVASERPVNVVPDYVSSSAFSAKTSKILAQSKINKTSLPSITALYNHNLEIIQ